MKKFKGKSNAYGALIEYFRKQVGYSRTDLSRELDLIGIPISGDELYRIEKQKMALKDFELVAICSILGIDFTELEKAIKENKKKPIHCILR